MAVVSCQELFEGRSASDTSKRRRQYVRKWEILTDNPLDDGAVAASHAGTPRLGQFYITPNAIDTQALVVDVIAEQDPDLPTRWIVTTKYDTELDFKNGIAPSESGTSPPSPGAQPNNPTARPPVFGISTSKLKVVATRALNQDTTPTVIDVLNSAGLPFDPPLEYDIAMPVLTITLHYGSFNLAWFRTYVGSVNSTTWYGFNPRVCLFDDCSTQSQYDNGIATVQATLKIAIKWDNWDFRVLDAGLYRKGTTPEGGGLFPILDKAGRPITEPVPLDGNGQRLPAGNPAVYNLFRVYPERNWVGSIP